MKPSVTAAEDDGRMRGSWGGGCLKEAGWAEVVVMVLCVFVAGGLTQSDAAVIGGNVEVCLNRPDSREK